MQHSYIFTQKILYFPNSCGDLEVSYDSLQQNIVCGRNLHMNETTCGWDLVVLHHTMM